MNEQRLDFALMLLCFHHIKGKIHNLQLVLFPACPEPGENLSAPNVPSTSHRIMGNIHTLSWNLLITHVVVDFINRAEREFLADHTEKPLDPSRRAPACVQSAPSNNPPRAVRVCAIPPCTSSLSFAGSFSQHLLADEVFFRIKIVLAGLINHANLTELCRRFIGDHLVEFPQLERSGIVLSSSHRQQISAQFASLNFHHMLELTL
jgi:hypothetical protein